MSWVMIWAQGEGVFSVAIDCTTSNGRVIFEDIFVCVLDWSPDGNFFLLTILKSRVGTSESVNISIITGLHLESEGPDNSYERSLLWIAEKPLLLELGMLELAELCVESFPPFTNWEACKDFSHRVLIMTAYYKGPSWWTFGRNYNAEQNALLPSKKAHTF